MSEILSDQQRLFWYFDENNGNFCLSNTVAVITYTLITYLTIMFFIIGHQVVNTKQKELLRAHEQFKRKQSAEKLEAYSIDEVATEADLAKPDEAEMGELIKRREPKA